MQLWIDARYAQLDSYDELLDDIYTEINVRDYGGPSYGPLVDGDDIKDF